MSDAGSQVEALIQPLEEDGPCGPDLTYERDFIELQRATEGVPEQISGDEVKPGEPPDWQDVEERALAVLQRAKDLRAAIALARAWLSTEGMSGLAAGLDLVHRLTETYWDAVHPRADEDGDLMLRFNSLGSLIDDAYMLLPIRQQPLVVSRQFGRFSLRDWRIATGKLRLPEGSEETPPERSLIESAFEGADLEELQASADASRRALESVGALQKTIDANAPSQGTSLQALQAELKEIVRLYDDMVGRRTGAEPAAEDADASGAGGGYSSGGSSGGGAPGQVRSRADVIRALDAVCGYYRDNEPSSPVPMLLTRAKRLVNMSFMEIVRDLTPSAVSEATIFSGNPEDGSSSSSGGSSDWG